LIIYLKKKFNSIDVALLKISLASFGVFFENSMIDNYVYNNSFNIQFAMLNCHQKNVLSHDKSFGSLAIFVHENSDLFAKAYIDSLPAYKKINKIKNVYSYL